MTFKRALSIYIIKCNSFMFKISPTVKILIKFMRIKGANTQDVCIESRLESEVGERIRSLATIAS